MNLIKWIFSPTYRRNRHLWREHLSNAQKTADEVTFAAWQKDHEELEYLADRVKQRMNVI